MLATQMPDTPPEGKDVKQVKPLAFPLCAKILLPCRPLFCLVVLSSIVTVLALLKV